MNGTAQCLVLAANKKKILDSKFEKNNPPKVDPPPPPPKKIDKNILFRIVTILFDGDSARMHEVVSTFNRSEKQQLPSVTLWQT